MPMKTRYYFTVSMDVDPAHEALFNEVYDDEHIPYLKEVPGVISVTRSTLEPFEIMIGGERKKVDTGTEPKYSAIYEIESPDVLVSDAWAEAVERGRWPGAVRPHTSNRRHVLRKVSE